MTAPPPAGAARRRATSPATAGTPSTGASASSSCSTPPPSCSPTTATRTRASQDICAAAGVAKGLFYWYFPTKQALFAELVRTMRQRLRRAQATAMDPTADPLTRIRQGTEASVRFHAEHAGYFALLDVERADATPRRAAPRGQRRLPAPTSSPSSARPRPTASSATSAAEALAVGVLGAVSSFTHAWRDGRIDMDADELRHVRRRLGRTGAAMPEPLAAPVELCAATPWAPRVRIVRRVPRRSPQPPARGVGGGGASGRCSSSPRSACWPCSSSGCSCAWCGTCPTGGSPAATSPAACCCSSARCRRSCSRRCSAPAGRPTPSGPASAPLWRDIAVRQPPARPTATSCRVLPSDELNAYACGGHLVVVTTFAIDELPRASWPACWPTSSATTSGCTPSP